MNWTQVKQLITNLIVDDTDLNRPGANNRKVLDVTPNGFKVQKGATPNQNLFVDWNMLKNCFNQLSTTDGYNGTFFRQNYPNKACCYVHIIGMIFVKAGIATYDSTKNAYF